MNENRFNMLMWAAGLVLSGILLLLFNLDLLVNYEPLAQYTAAIALALASAGFFGGYTAKPTRWWRLIPAWTLLALAGMAVLSVAPIASPRLTAALLFVGLALAFGHIYIVNRQENWWAIIPGGFMFVVSVVTALSALADRLETLGAALFVGMGLVFLVLFIAIRSRGQWWPLIPAIVLIWFGLFVFAPSGDQMQRLLRWWPVVLILIGLAVGWRASPRRTPQDKISVNVAPAAPKTPAQPAAAPLAPKTAGEEAGVLGAYSQPAPGASVEVLPDDDATP